MVTAQINMAPGIMKARKLCQPFAQTEETTQAGKLAR